MNLPQLDGVTHRTVEARGLRFHVAEAGAGEPVVLVHGWPQHWWMWRHVVPRLAPQARLVMIDLRGFGWSDAPPGRYDKQTLADDVLAVMDALGLERVRLMAHDWGAWSGFLACLAAPERFEAFLALGSPRPSGRPNARQLREVWRFAYQVLLGSPGLGRRLIADPRFIERTILVGAVHREAWTPDDLRAFTAVLAEPARARASARLYRTFLAREVARSPRRAPARPDADRRRQPRPGHPRCPARWRRARRRRRGRRGRARLRALRARGAAGARGAARSGPLRAPLIR